MSHRRQRLSRKLVRVRRIEERAELVHAEALRHELEAARVRERACEASATAVGDELERHAARGVSGRTVAEYVCLLEAARRTIDEAASARQHAERAEKKATSRLLEAVRRRQAAEKLADRVSREVEQEKARVEQRTLDEIAASSFPSGNGSFRTGTSSGRSGA